MAAFRVVTTYSSDTLEIITTDCESLTESLSPFQAKYPLGFCEPLVVEATEIYKVTFKYPVKIVSTARDILFRRRPFSEIGNTHIKYYMLNRSDP